MTPILSTLIIPALACLALAAPIVNDTPRLRAASSVIHQGQAGTAMHPYLGDLVRPDRGVHLGEVVNPR
ncbi:hypothetical protein BO99DRAFT_430471 [Aspergillus violaceofuscus CBS 115571]|uniref:Uncharacterized protein n=1 Tax=Aspergillus violaceofuscus (strain CBS 115571) TaxID=1450538 RepID=A0A2V5HZA7_ASPV1|nr:hypothetical protein BO99DRAFT_430471 [Aspergillus violaceofuscus CBS 115571]